MPADDADQNDTCETVPAAVTDVQFTSAEVVIVPSEAAAEKVADWRVASPNAAVAPAEPGSAVWSLM